MRNPFSRGVLSVEERFRARSALMRPILRARGSPVLVHAVNTQAAFQRIIRQRAIRLPSRHASLKKCLEMERFLGLDDGIFLSSGFVYATAYGFRYNLLFDLDVLKGARYYKRPVVYKAYEAVISYLHREDGRSLARLAQKNALCGHVVRKYLDEGVFEFWNAEKEVFDLLVHHKEKERWQRLARAVERELLSPSYVAARRHARANYATSKSPEIVVQHDLSLDDATFIGFYIEGDVATNVLSFFKERYPGKMLYDGKKVRYL